MKKKLFTCLLALSAGVFTAAGLHAQDTTTIGEDLKNAGKKTGKAVGKGAKTVGNKTAEIASKGKSEVLDKVYEGKQGPNGEKIYIDGHSKYYYVDSKGHRKYVKASKLKDQ
jgi:hypothetical protein